MLPESLLSEELQVCSFDLKKLHFNLANDMQYLEGMSIAFVQPFSPKELQEALDTIRKIFAEAGLEHLLTDPDALKAEV